MVGGVFCCSLHWFSASVLAVLIPLPVFISRVVASLPSLNPRRDFYGSATREDDRGDETTQLRGEDAEVVPWRDGGLSQALPAVSGSTDAGADPGVSVALAGARTIEQLAERGGLRPQIFLSAGFG